MVSLRWPKGVACTACGRKDVRFLENQKKWQCKSVHAKRPFMVRVGIIFEDSPISLDTWLTAVWMIANCKNGVSSYEVAPRNRRNVDVRLVHDAPDSPCNAGQLVRLPRRGRKIVEVDESLIGGLRRNMRGKIRERKIQGAGGPEKAAVVGILEGGGVVWTMAPASRRRKALHGAIERRVGIGSIDCAAALPSYEKTAEGFAQKLIGHAFGYAVGAVQTNGVENYWSLLKRGIKRTDVSVEPFYLFGHLDEQAFHFNDRENQGAPIHDGKRHDSVLSHVLRKRLAYAQLAGKVSATDSDSYAP